MYPEEALKSQLNVKLNKFSGYCTSVPMISQSFLFNPSSIRLYLLMRFFSRAFLTNALAPGAIFSIGINRRSATVCPADRKCCPTGVLVLTWPGNDDHTNDRIDPILDLFLHGISISIRSTI